MISRVSLKGLYGRVRLEDLCCRVSLQGLSWGGDHNFGETVDSVTYVTDSHISVYTRESTNIADGRAFWFYTTVRSVKQSLPRAHAQGVK